MPRLSKVRRKGEMLRDCEDDGEVGYEPGGNEEDGGKQGYGPSRKFGLDSSISLEIRYGNTIGQLGI